ncbi:MAG: ABC transporter ATP-binding protein [Bacteroidia bacterium]|nr:MAG: ABC transporter ATP-binding protein [Bacteroidia bacterium]
MNLPSIEIKDLSKSYGKARGIEKVSLTVDEGEIFGFIGPNGAGKSTTIRLLLNLIFPTGGSARIMGMDIIRESKKIKSVIGYIPSDANAYHSMNVKEFLSYCAMFYRVPQAQHRIAELSGLFDLDLKRRISELSMGNRKKVSIIQSLLHHPGLLIVDEPTTGLDPLMQEQFFELLRTENRRGMTIFFSSHILSEVQMFCKRVAVIKEGRIIRTENIETLRSRQLKKVQIVFADPSYNKDMRIKGISDIKDEPGNAISFIYSGEINDMTAMLAQRNIINLTIEEPSLEEIFMHYYK